MTAQLLSIRHYPQPNLQSSSFFDLPGPSSLHARTPKPGTYRLPTNCNGCGLVTKLYNFYRYFIRGKNARPSEDDFIVKIGRNPRLKMYDKYLRSFQFKKALDSVLAVNLTCLIAMTTIY